MDLTGVLTAGALAAVVLEGLKWLIRWLKKDYLFEFPVKFYAFLLPVFTFAVEPLLAFLSVGEYVWPTDWRGWLMQLVVVVLSSLVATVAHKLGIKGLSDKAKARLS